MVKKCISCEGVMLIKGEFAGCNNRLCHRYGLLSFVYKEG